MMRAVIRFDRRRIPQNADIVTMRVGAALFALVISVTLLVSVLSMSGLVLMRIDRRDVDQQLDVILAKRHAHSAVELALSRISQHSDWRTRYPNGEWETASMSGASQMNLEGIDPLDSRLDDSITDSVQIIGTGIVGVARQKEAVTLDFTYKPLDCLEAAVATGNDVTCNGATIQADALISSRDDIDAGFSNLYADVEAVDQIRGGTYHGQRNSGEQARQLPDSSSALTSYWQDGTWISIGMFPYRSGAFRIENLTFNPTTNPAGLFGNSQGIYVIYCYGYNVVVDDSQFHGTLVLLSAGSSTEVRGESVFSPAVTGYPSLLVEGRLTINLDDDGTLGGIIYATDDVFVRRLPQLNGTLVVGDRLEVTGPMNIVHSSDSLNSPPPGFRDPLGMMVIRPGSWKRMVD